MAILAFQKPDKVIMLDATDTFGRFEFRPLEPGFGVTVGNALRRILLSSLEGFAITSIKIQGVDHEFDTIPGVIESVVEIILNLKEIRFKREVAEEEGELVKFTVSGKQEFKAEEISKNLNNFVVLNPDHHICFMEPNVSLEIEMRIGKGRGYVPSEENRLDTDTIGTIPIDSIFSPIKNVNYWVEDYRVEQKTDYNKLNIEITTDGSIHPKDALTEAAKILIYHFMLFSDEKISLEVTQETSNPEVLDEESLRMRHMLLTKLSDMELSVRALNCLKAASIETFADLVTRQRSELGRFRNFGKKSMNEIDALMERVKLNFGMDVSKYNVELTKKTQEENEAQ